MLTRRSWFVYAALLAAWILLIGWQVAEHERVKKSARAVRVQDAVYWSKNLGVQMRSLRFPNRSQQVIIPEEVLESNLKDLVNEGELHSVLLLNATKDQVAAAGAPIDSELREKLLAGEIPEDKYWDDKTQTVTLLNLVDFGTNILVLPFSEAYRTPPGFGTNTTAAPDSTNAALAASAAVAEAATNISTTNSQNPPPAAGATSLSANSDTNNPTRGAGRGGRRPRIITPTPEMIQKKGVHNFIIAMSTREMLATCRRDLWLRVIIGILATFSFAGSAVAWRNLTKTSELQIRLVRASELNSHLKEMNLAAAGLAHETRNPLNIVRGLAQMISRQENAASEVRARSREIIDETDRITAQLNEFINYSRPREVRRAATNLNAVVAEVVRALNYDIEENKVQIRILAPPITIEADEQLLRQALFNLVLNAIQAVPAGGEIQIRASKFGGSEAFVEVADNGPGVAPEHRSELFKPYFTTHAEGTGLGLAVVQQIILAHGWEIECVPNQPSGAIFRVTHIKALH